MLYQHLFICQVFIELTLWARQGAKHWMKHGEKMWFWLTIKSGVLEEGGGT